MQKLYLGQETNKMKENDKKQLMELRLLLDQMLSKNSEAQPMKPRRKYHILTKENKQAIRELLSWGFTGTEIAKKIGITSAGISYFRKNLRKTYKNTQ